MKSISIRKLYSLHSWVGLITGVLMFVIAFTGALSVFARSEITSWGNPEIRGEVSIDSQRIEKLVAEYAQQVPESYLEEIMIFFPGARRARELYIVFEAHSGEPSTEESASQEHKHSPPVGKMFSFDIQTLELNKTVEGEIREIFESGSTDVAEFITHFHADLLLGRPVGLLITGLLGLTLMASIVTGIIIHRKVLRQLFTFRPKKSFSLMLNDGHKVAGIWGLLFHAVIGFSGAFLGLALVILVPAAAFVSFEGDQDKLIETFTTIPEPVIQQVAAPTQIANILDHARQLSDEVNISVLTIRGYGDQGAMAYGSMFGGDRMATQTAVYTGADAQLQEVFTFYARLEGFSGQILDILFPLHFGNFGGVLIKTIWTLLGMSTALLPLTGMMLWVERGMNSPRPKYSRQTYVRFNRFIIGGCGGLVLACAALLPAQLVLKETMLVEDIGGFIGWLFFPLWLLAMLWAAVVRQPKMAARQILWLTSLLLLLVTPIDLVCNGMQMFSLMIQGYFLTISVNLTCLLLGGGTAYLLLRWQKQGARLSTDSAGLNEEVLQ